MSAPRTELDVPATGRHDARPPRALTHDLLVLAGAVALFAVGQLAHAALSRWDTARYEHAGLSVEVPRGWLPTARAAGDGELPVNLVYHPIRQPLTRVEILIEEEPAFAGPLDFTHRTRRKTELGAIHYEEHRAQDRGGWKRVAFAYFAPGKAGPVRIEGVDYTRVNAGRVYTVRFHAPSTDELARLEDELAPTLEVR